MVAVTYHAPTSLDEAVALLSSSELPAKVLAGGTDLIIQMQKLVTEQRLIVDLKRSMACNQPRYLTRLDIGTIALLCEVDQA